MLKTKEINQYNPSDIEELNDEELSIVTGGALRGDGRIWVPKKMGYEAVTVSLPKDFELFENENKDNK